MKNYNYKILSNSGLSHKVMIVVLVFCTFHSELFPKDPTDIKLQEKENEFVIADCPDFFVFDAFIGFSEERYDGSMDSQLSEISFSVLNPRLYQINESIRPEYRSFIIDY